MKTGESYHLKGNFSNICGGKVKHKKVKIESIKSGKGVDVEKTRRTWATSGSVWAKDRQGGLNQTE